MAKARITRLFWSLGIQSERTRSHCSTFLYGQYKEGLAGMFDIDVWELSLSIDDDVVPANR
jgi:hypothetical protein